MREENRFLTSECDQARAELKELQNQPQDQGELETLKAENARLQTEVAQFQQIKQMLGGNAGGIAEPTTPAVAEKASHAATAPMAQPSPQPKAPVATQQKRIRDEEQALGKSTKLST